MRLIRNWGHGLLALVACFGHGHARADALVMKTFAALAKEDLVWSDIEHSSLGGQPMYWRAFESPKKMLVVASDLGEFSGVFQRALMLQGKVLLSGVSGPRHWVAELTATRQGVSGVVSMLYLGEHSVHPAGGIDLNWLDDLAQQHFGHSVQTHLNSATQRIYSTSVDAATLSGVLHRRFTEQGWSRAAGPASEGYGHWQRGADAVMTLTHQTGPRTTVFVHHIQATGLAEAGN